MVADRCGNAAAPSTPSDTINRRIPANGTPSGCIVGRYHLYFFSVPEERVVQKIGERNVFGNGRFFRIGVCGAEHYACLQHANGMQIFMIVVIKND